MAAGALILWKLLAGSFIARIVALSALAAAALWGYGAYERHVGRVEARIEIVEKVNHDAEVLTDQALRAREPARRPGAAERLRQGGSCRDC